MISIAIHPVDRAGRFEARLDGRLLCTSQTPYLDAARVLIAHDHDPNETLAMYRTGQTEPALTGRLGEAAGLAIHGGRTRERFATWQPYTQDAHQNAPAAARHTGAGLSKGDRRAVLVPQLEGGAG